MKLSPHKFAQYRTHHEIDVDMDGEFWLVPVDNEGEI